MTGFPTGCFGAYAYQEASSLVPAKVTNGFRSEWGAQTYAAFRSVVSTAKTNNRSILDDLRQVLATASSREAIA